MIGSVKLDTEVSKFVHLFNKGIKKFGLHKIKQKLNELDVVKNKNIPTLILNKIFEEINFVYGIAPEILIYSKKRGDITRARVMTMILLKKHLTDKQNEIAIILRTTPATVNHRLSSFSKKTRYDGRDIYGKIFHEKDFINNLENISQNITKFATELNSGKAR